MNDPIETSTPSMVLTVKSCALPLTLPPPPPKKARVVVVVVVVVAEASVAPAKAVAASARRARGVVPANAEDVDATPRAPRAALARHETVARARADDAAIAIIGSFGRGGGARAFLSRVDECAGCAASGRARYLSETSGRAT